MILVYIDTLIYNKQTLAKFDKFKGVEAQVLTVVNNIGVLKCLPWHPPPPLFLGLKKMKISKVVLGFQNFWYDFWGVGEDVWRWLCRHVCRKTSTSVDGGPSGGFRVRMRNFINNLINQCCMLTHNCHRKTPLRPIKNWAGDPRLELKLELGKSSVPGTWRRIR